MNIIKSILFLTILFLVSCNEGTTKVVIVGDSWASFVCTLHSLDKAIEAAGLSAPTNSDCNLTTKLGAKAIDWLDADFHKATQLALLQKSVDVIYLSLGGNDFLSLWNKNQTADEQTAIFDNIAQSIQKVVDNYRTQRPEIKILISAYDFPRFTLNHPIKKYAEMYDQMGQPTPGELNSAILKFSKRVSRLADNQHVFYIQHYGLMHYYIGNSEFNLPVQTTLNPSLISSQNDVNRSGGDMNLQNDANAMLLVDTEHVNVPDAFHLSQFGFDRLSEHAVQHYFKNWFAPK